MLVTTEQQAFLLAHLESSQMALENAVQSFAWKHWKVEPAPGSWSGSECSEHVVIVASLILGRMDLFSTMPEELYAEEDSARKDEAVLGVTARRTKVEAPESTLPVGCYASAEETLNAYRVTNGKHCDIVRAGPAWLRGRFINHPFLNKLDGYQWILAVSCHTLRHVEQLRQINATLIQAEGETKQGPAPLA